MRAAMFPQQNLKRREAAFCWARRRFTREMQKCASPFVEVRQIEFLAEKLLTYIATNLHISHQWTCERERFASQEAKRRGEPAALL